MEVYVNHKLIWRDIVRNKVVSSITILFIAAASMLLSLAGILSVNLFGAIDQLMSTAKTPHFLQMHSGELAIHKLEEFAERNETVEAFQVLEFLNIDNEQIVLGSNSLISNLQDNGFCIQSTEFDFLLDLENKPVVPKKGELYVPVCYYKDGTAKLGETAVIHGKSFIIAGFIRDSQMNSTLASSKRFLVSKEDYEQLKPQGRVEYLIEFRLKESGKLNAFETAYSAAGLPANGPAITWPLFRMLSAISDGIMIAVLLLISFLVIFIALLCIRFTLLAKIEEDSREIGVMKAIGIRGKEIRRTSLTTYTVLAGIGGILGYALSLLFRTPLQENIRLNLGSGGNAFLSLLLGMAGVILLILFILFYINQILHRFDSISAVQAVRQGASEETRLSKNSPKLSKNSHVPVNLFLAWKDVLLRKRLYLTMLIVVIVACFIMTVPQNLYHTISEPQFITYLGIGSCDLRIDIQQTAGIEEKAKEIEAFMEQDLEIAKYALFLTKNFGLKLENGTTENIKVELGDHSAFPLQYTAGRQPISEGEIAISDLYAEELEKKVGDELVLFTAGDEKQLIISGIYSDITNGGKTAKAVFRADNLEAAWSTICVNLTDSKQLSEKLSEYKNRFSYAKVSDIGEYITQTFGQTLRSIQTAAWAAVLVALGITLFVTLLFMKLLIAKDRYSIAVMKSIGFTTSDIIKQYIWRAVIIIVAGVGLGILLAGTLGETLAGMAISSLGASAFQFSVDLPFTWIIAPGLFLLVALFAARLGTRHTGKISVSEAIRE